MKVEITSQIPVGGASNLTVGSEHSTVPCPKEHSRYESDVWVMGEKEPIRLHSHEYKITDNSEPDHVAYAIMVTEYNMTEINKVMNEQLTKSKDERFKGKKFEIKGLQKLALVDGEDIFTDEEAYCHLDASKNGIELDIYRASEKMLDENGKETGSMSIFMFPVCQISLTVEQLEPFIKGKTTLAEFMGDRFLYNNRIKSNIKLLIDNLKK
jgi:hypothetical protein